MKKAKKTVEIPTSEDIRLEKQRLKYREVFFKTLKTVLFSLLAVASAASILATLIFPVLEVTGSSMESSLFNGDIVFLYDPVEYKQGNLCAFYWQNKLLIKRVIACPGDTVSLDAGGNVFVNGSLLDEPYVDEFCLGECDITFPCVVPNECYFVLGDHRATSIDSRSQSIGCVSKEQMIGKLFLRVWPLPSITFFK